MRYLLGALLWLACSAVPAAAGIDFGRYHALIIGINEYQHLPKLETAVNDASAVHDLLSREYGYESTLLLNPTRAQLILAFDKLRAELAEDDNLLIFFAGHGILDRPSGEGFWLAVNATEDSQLEWLPVSTVTRLLKASPVRHALVVVDSCYSGTLTRDAPAELATGPARAAELERLVEKRARKALTSGGLEPVADSGGDGHSVFTRAFLESLQRTNAVIDGYQLYRTLRRNVVLNAAQTPEYADIRFAGDEGGDFLFVPLSRRPAPATASPTGAAAPDKEAMFWRSIEASRIADDYRAYLEQYPKGAFAALARARAERYAALTPPAAPAPERRATPPPAEAAPALTPVEGFYVLTKNAHVREKPTVESSAVATLPSGTELYVPGRTADGQWLKVEQDGQSLGFVYAPLLQEREAWRRAEAEAAGAEHERQDAARRAAEREAQRQAADDARRRAEAERDAQRQAAEEARRRAEAAQRQAEAERLRRTEQARQPAAPPPQVALNVPPAPRGPDGPWRLSVRASSFRDGDMGGIDNVIEVQDGRYSSGLITRGRFRLSLSFEIVGDRIAGSLTVKPNAEFEDTSYKIEGKLAGDGYRQQSSRPTLRRVRGSYDSQDLDIVFRLERAR